MPAVPLESVVKTYGLLAALLLVAAGAVSRLVAQKIADGFEQRFASALARAEELHRSTLALATSVDTDLRKYRVEVYAPLWEMTGALPQWPRDRHLTYADLQRLSEGLR